MMKQANLPPRRFSKGRVDRPEMNPRAAPKSQRECPNPAGYGGAACRDQDDLVSTLIMRIREMKLTFNEKLVTGLRAAECCRIYPV